MGLIVGNMSLKTLTILIAVLTVGLISSFFSEHKRRPGHPANIVFPVFLVAGLVCLGERYIREYSHSEKIIETEQIIDQLLYLFIFIVFKAVPSSSSLSLSALLPE